MYRQWFTYFAVVALIISSFSFTGRASAAASDIKGHWAEAQLTEWQTKGLLKGYSDGTLKPDHSITRAELIILINRYFNYTDTAAIKFTDIKESQWLYADIAKAVKAGYIKGYTDGSIRPNQPVSREETAVMLSKVLQLPAASSDALKNMKDAAKIASWSKAAVGALVSNKVIGGYNDGTFRPSANLTRAEGVVLIDRSAAVQTAGAPTVLNVKEGQTYKSGVLPNWKDASGTTTTATLNGANYVKGTGITAAGDYTLVVTAMKPSTKKASSTTVKFKIDPQTKLVAYVPGWKDWSDANTVDVAKLTHIDYAFTHVKDNQLIPFEGDFNDDQNYAYLNSLRAKNPNLKILNSVGGWGADGFSDAAFTAGSRDIFTSSIVDYVKKYNLDGVDLDWEYPTQTSGDIIKARPEDKQNFTLLLQTLREKLNKLGLENNKYYEISIAAAAAAAYPTWVELDKITPLLDNYNLMTYDFAGGWVPNASHHTNLYGTRSVDSTVQAFLKNNVPASKLVIGGAFYAHKWTDVASKENNGLGAKAKGTGDTPVYGTVIATYNKESGYTRYWDEASKAAYLFNGSTFLSFDDPQSMSEKGKYARDHKLGGAMFWEYSQDTTGALLESVYNGLNGVPYVADTTSVPNAPKVVNVIDGQTYKTGILPNWTDAVGTASAATLNGKEYVKGTGITEAGDYTLIVTAAHGKSFKTASTTVKFKVVPETKVIAYIPGWKEWSTANPITGNKLTHILYAFTHVENGKIIPLKDQKYDDANYAYLQSLRAQNPNLKLLNSVGGWGADGFSDAVLTSASRNTFANSIVDYVKKYKLDGIDLDWEYPTQSADGVIKARPEDKQNYSTFLKLLREKLNAQGLVDNKYYEITIAVGATQKYLDGVEMPEIIKVLDNVNLMTYDFAGGWSTKTDHHTNLYGGAISVDSSVKLFQKNGVPNNKIVIGAAFYSHIWTDVKSSANHGLGQEAKGSGDTPTYSDIVTKYNTAAGYTRYWDDTAKAPYLFDGKTFVSYDDPQSVAAKAQYVLDQKLGGAMFWEYSQDNTGTLLDALNKVIPVK
ncbi:glycosyl hydrolase family 18 protein [Paenibacillus shirakamiensis]|uniref:glycosyl hydrolase family 18 protein n=1 Tax=Paenibacillus shirakamiensis TaxID=1265935 RepID=UPI001FD96F9E|nr:glycosyl hydrolase family 18 protein [Paenibacillus shirakamiensis]